MSVSVFVAGIMSAMAASPRELQIMSLFQDIKLKRHKVDSRCSSDGERRIFWRRGMQPAAYA
jgi:hypothetical protein